jgi:hypothetical protein
MIPWWFALFGWPIVAAFLYRRLSIASALCATILGGFLLLPSKKGLDLPGLPELDKKSIPVLAALVLTVVALRKDQGKTFVLPGWLPRDRVIVLLLLLLVGGTVGTVMTNRDALVYGPRVLQAMRPYDGISMLVAIGFWLIPLMLGRKVLASREGQHTLLVIIVVSAMIYAFPTLYEVRMSPQINMKVYGFFPSSFLQHMRGEGFRPTVFLNHGLVLSLFLALAVIGAIGLWRIAKPDDRLKWAVVAAFLFVTMVLTKSLGPVLITLVLAPVAIFAKPRLQLLIVTCVAGMVLTYPVLRAAHLVPVDQIMAFAEDIDPARAQSFGSRLEHEETLLGKAQQRPVFGWGVWGRQRVFDDYGRNITVTDGTWIIELGAGGWVRYIGFFGLLCWPVIGLLFARRDKLDPVCMTLALILCAKLVDIIPNSGIPAYNWLIVGSLIGRLEMRKGTENEAPAPQEAAASVTGYKREKPPTDVVVRPEGPRYARTFPDKETGRARKGTTDQTKRPAPFYVRPKFGAGYRK